MNLGASSGRDDDIYTFNYRINISGKSYSKNKELRVHHSDNRQTVIDNVTWTSLMEAWKPPVTPPDDDDNPEEDALPFRAVHSLSVGDDFTLSGCEEYSVLDNIVGGEITGDDIDTDIPGNVFCRIQSKRRQRQ